MNEKKPTVSLCTLGCRVNQYESDAIAERLTLDGFTVVPFGEPCDLVIVNTCTVTAESDRKSRNLIRRASLLGQTSCGRRTPVIVTGCFSQVSPETVPTNGGEIYLCGNGEKDRIPALARQLIEGREIARSPKPQPMDQAPYDTFSLHTPQRTRSYIKIEDGCENRCAYCIIPKARGKVRSKPAETVLAEAAALGRAGCREIILTGIETASYGRDFESGSPCAPREPHGARLASLLQAADKVPGIQRIGLGSLEPTVLSEAFAAAVAPLRHVLPHYHLSLQSGSSTVLQRMRRRYTAERAEECLARMRHVCPDVTFSADVIVGFPGETDAEFCETVAFFERNRFLHLHIFPFSPRKGTEAAQMPHQIPAGEKHARVKALETAQTAVRTSLLQDYVSTHAYSDHPVLVLVEKAGNGMVSGHSQHFAEVFAPMPPSFSPQVGEIVKVRLSETDGKVCRGIVLPSD